MHTLLSVPSERIFSEVSTIYERKRSRLTGEHAEQLIFLQHNLVLLSLDYLLILHFMQLFKLPLLYKISGTKFLLAFTRDNAEPEELLHLVFV